MTPSRTADVVIVGGSAAGLFVAYLVAREGVKVRVFDASDPFRATDRTLIVTSRLTDVLGFVPGEAIVNRITRFELFSPRRTASVRMEDPDLVVERAKVIQLLAERALSAGAEIFSGHQFLGLAPGAQGPTVTIRDTKRDRVESVRASVLVGADGGFSRVARTAERDGHRTAPLLQGIVRLPRGTPADVARVWFDPSTTPYFYWLVPESPDVAAVGLISPEGRSIRAHLDHFLSRQKLEPLEIQAARVPLHAGAFRLWRRVAGCDIYLVGDAAGQVKVTTVGGLVTGLRGAKAVASAILERGDYRRGLGSLRRELRLHLWIRSVLNRFGGEDYDELLGLLNPSTTELLGVRSRDDLASTFVRLLVTQPRLLSLGARVLLRPQFGRWTQRVNSRRPLVP